jgi:hypothetical protein
MDKLTQIKNKKVEIHWSILTLKLGCPNIVTTIYTLVVLVGRKANSLPRPLASCLLAGIPRFWPCHFPINKLGDGNLLGAIEAGQDTSQTLSKNTCAVRTRATHVSESTLCAIKVLYLITN